MTELTWETVDPNAVYPQERFRAVDGELEYRLMPQINSAGRFTCWHLLVLNDNGYARNLRTLEIAKGVAALWAAEATT